MINENKSPKGLNIKKIKLGNQIEDNDKTKNPCFRVIYCSRTHSQIQEFIKELKKTNFAKNLKIAHLGSKRNACLYEEIRNAPNSQTSNNLCEEKRDSKLGCKFYSKAEIIKKRKSFFV